MANRITEYIGQLEGEVAAKTNEANEYRAKNQALMAENQRLSDLTRMLLSSSAFSNFLNDLSSNGLPAPTAPVSEPSAAVQQALVPLKFNKDPNPNQVLHQQSEIEHHGNAHVGMALIPDSALDFSTLDLNNNGFPSNMDHGYNHAQVFSVMEVPQGPAVDRIDTAILSGKSSNFVGSFSSSEDCKYQAPNIERMAVIIEEADEDQAPTMSCPEVEFDESDPAFALYMDAPLPAKRTPAGAQELLFGDLESEKVFARHDLVVEAESDDITSVSAAAMERFERLCSRLDAAFERIGNVTSHL